MAKCCSTDVLISCLFIDFLAKNKDLRGLWEPTSYVYSKLFWMILLFNKLDYSYKYFQRCIVILINKTK